MPELPEVETVCMGLRSKLIGKTISDIELFRPNLRFPFPENLANKLSGQKIESISRVAKYILVQFENSDLTWVTHLGMTGRYIFCPFSNDLGKHSHVRIRFHDLDEQLLYEDPRRFGYMGLCEGKIENHPFFEHLGYDPFSEELTSKIFYEKLQNKKTPIKNLLLDQKIVTGIGNIYACEALYWAKIHPETKSSSLTKKQAATLLQSIRDVLEHAIQSGGSSLRDYKKTDGTLGYFQHKWAIYGKKGEACPHCNCNLEETNGIQSVKQAGRTTYYCQYQARS